MYSQVHLIFSRSNSAIFISMGIIDNLLPFLTSSKSFSLNKVFNSSRLKNLAALKRYRLQGVEISDKHIECILRQMLRKVEVTESGDSDFIIGDQVEFSEVVKVNKKLLAEGSTPAKFNRLLLGITKASLATESFISAASFQETTRVLTEAAVTGKVDKLRGLKENVVIGRLVPSGTGYNVDTKEEIDVADLESEISEAMNSEEDSS